MHAMIYQFISSEAQYFVFARFFLTISFFIEHTLFIEDMVYAKLHN